ncbi:macoilin-2 [Cimex lectularius]|uniref:Macoilin n=1 Tax=Cimex lectularius TaxID=79782 RepID=A0A8I6TB11_CIMLE|nr:macoilin-2 [Cimex lectularius]XP_014239385.1 macoilin-2 [Cimex lectularius]
MKRRNGECPKLRRPIKRNKITDGIYGSTIVYLKFFLLWAFVLLADFLLEFRFEFLWPFWLLVRSVHDSYKYQGLAFSVFFMSIAVTSDMICYFFIPVQWLFFAASTYVWVQYVWHTEKGICLPTVMLWLLFAYMEAAVRLKDLRHMPFHLDLCRPFAAHCIGYPVVTLGFGFKSYVSFRIRQRRQRDVRKENSFYMNLLQQALPVEGTSSSQQGTPPEKTKGAESNGVGHHGMSTSQNCGSKSSHRKSLDKGAAEPYTNGSITHNVEYTEKIKTNGSCRGSNKQSNSGGGGLKMLCFRSRDSGSSAPPVTDEENVNQSQTSSSQMSNNTTSKGGGKGGKGNSKGSKGSAPPKENDTPHKDEYCLKLESEVKRLKGELQSSKQNESDLKSQLSSTYSAEKAARAEVLTLRHHNEELESKLQNMVSTRANERQNIVSLEKRLAEERRLRCTAESQLAQDRKAKRDAQRECSSEACRQRRRDLEGEVKSIRRDLKLKEEICASADRELKSLLQYKESQTGADVLLNAVSVLQDKNLHLENSLSAETRIKLDLFSALGEAKRHLEIKDSLIRSQEREIEELKSKMAQVLAVMPTADFLVHAPSAVGSRSIMGGGTKLRGLVVSQNSTMPAQSSIMASSASNLDPNATVYTPKQGHLTTEA